MVRGRSVNPSYRTVPAALAPGATFFGVGDTAPSIDADAVGYADSQVNELTGCRWAIDTLQYGDVTVKIGVLKTLATIRTDATLPYDAVPAGSILARMRTRGIMRTGA